MVAQPRFFDFSRLGNGVFQTRVRAAFEPRKPRHRLLRFALGMVGLALVVLLVLFGVVVGATMLVLGIGYKLLKRGSRPVARDARIVDAQYRVIDKSMPAR